MSFYRDPRGTMTPPAPDDPLDGAGYHHGNRFTPTTDEWSNPASPSMEAAAPPAAPGRMAQLRAATRQTNAAGRQQPARSQSPTTAHAASRDSAFQHRHPTRNPNWRSSTRFGKDADSDAFPLSLNDVCPNVALASLQPDEEGTDDVGEAQRRRLYLLTAAACCVTNAHVLVATSDAADASLDVLYGRAQATPSGGTSTVGQFVKTPEGAQVAQFRPPPGLIEVSVTGPTSTRPTRGHARTTSAGHMPSGAAADEVVALERVTRLIAECLPPNHKATPLRLTDATTREDIAVALDAAQAISPAPTLQRLANSKRLTAARSAADVRKPTASHFRVPSNNARARGHARTVSGQSTDSAQTPEPSNADGEFDEDAMDVIGPSPAVQPRVSRRTNEAAASSAALSTPTAAHAGGGKVGAGDAAARAGNHTYCTTVLGGILLTVGLNRLRPGVAEVFSEFLATGWLPPSNPGGQPNHYPSVTVVSLAHDADVPALPARLRCGFTLSMAFSLAKMVRPNRHGGAGRRDSRSQHHAPSVGGSSSTSMRTSPVPHTSNTTAGGHLAAAPTTVATEREHLRSQMNHDLFVVLAAARVTARTQRSAGSFGSAMSAFRTGENGAVVHAGLAGLVGCRIPSPGVAHLRASGRLCCNTAIERYLRQNVALLRAVFAPHGIAFEGATLQFDRALDVVQAAATLLSRLSIDADACDGGAGNQPGYDETANARRRRAAVSGASVESVFTMLTRAAVSASTASDFEHVDSRYVPRERRKNVGRHVERVFVTADDVLCLLPHLLAHHVCVPADLLQTSDNFTLKVGGSNNTGLRGQLSSGVAEMVQSGGPSLGFASPLQSAYIPSQAQPAAAAAAAERARGILGSAGLISCANWDAMSVEHSARAVRNAGPGGLSHTLGIPATSTAAGLAASPSAPASGQAAFPAEPQSPGGGPHQHGAAVPAMLGANAQLGVSSNLSLSAQLNLQDTTGDFAALGRRVSFSSASAAFGDSNADLIAALAAQGAPSRRGHERTVSSQSNNNEDDSTANSVDGGAASPAHHRRESGGDPTNSNTAVPWPMQLEVTSVASYSRSWDALCARLLDNQQMLRAPV